jgi:hypothetical protein
MESWRVRGGACSQFCGGGPLHEAGNRRPLRRPGRPSRVGPRSCGPGSADGRRDRPAQSVGRCALQRSWPPEYRPLLLRPALDRRGMRHARSAARLRGAWQGFPQSLRVRRGLEGPHVSGRAATLRAWQDRRRKVRLRPRLVWRRLQRPCGGGGGACDSRSGQPVWRRRSVSALRGLRRSLDRHPVLDSTLRARGPSNRARTKMRRSART